MVVRRIGQILVDLGFITDEQLEVILDEQQQRPGALLGKIAEDMGLITDEQLAQALAEQLGMQTVQLADVTLPPDVLEKITETMAQMYRIVPVQFDGDDVDGGHLRSAESDGPRRIADFPGLRHPHGGGHRARSAGRDRQVLFVGSGHDGADHRRNSTTMTSCFRLPRTDRWRLQLDRRRGAGR